ncbi:hypothetical protein FOA52_003786 [Chlamydomonas sp. UWO 241]|nr:hypothetical protein FOA52_003786 [Chlamydomonas sp. UWO 241]
MSRRLTANRLVPQLLSAMGWAQLGGAPCLIQLYEECSNTLRRQNAQSAIANITMLAKNGLVLLEARLPEEFLVLVPMRLTKMEVAELVVDFPDGGLQEAFDKDQKERLDMQMHPWQRSHTYFM